jgi:hypothetical protein
MQVAKVQKNCGNIFVSLVQNAKIEVQKLLFLLSLGQKEETWAKSEYRFEFPASNYP